MNVEVESLWNYSKRDFRTMVVKNPRVVRDIINLILTYFHFRKGRSFQIVDKTLF